MNDQRGWNTSSGMPSAQPLGYAGGLPRDGGPMLGPVGMSAAGGMRGWLLLFATLMFIAVGFGGLGLTVLVFVALAAFVSGEPGGGLAMMGLALFYLVPMALWFFPALHLARCASAIRRLREHRESKDLDDTLRHMKAFWKFLGIVFLVTIGLYVLMFLGFLIIGVAAGGAFSGGGF